MLRSLVLLACLSCAACFHAAPLRPALAPATSSAAASIQMNRICDITGKRANNANRVSFSNKHFARWQYPNLQTKKLFSKDLDRYVKVKVATSTLRTIRKNGLDETAKKYGVDLSKFAVGNVIQAPDAAAAPAPELAVEDDE